MEPKIREIERRFVSLDCLVKSHDIIYVDTSFFFPTIQRTTSFNLTNFLFGERDSDISQEDILYFIKNMEQNNDFVSKSTNLRTVHEVPEELRVSRKETVKKEEFLSSRKRQTQRQLGNLLNSYNSDLYEIIGKMGRIATHPYPEAKYLIDLAIHLREAQISDYERIKSAQEKTTSLKQLLRRDRKTDEQIFSMAFHDTITTDKSVAILSRDSDFKRMLTKFYGVFFNQRVNVPFFNKLRKGKLTIYFGDLDKYFPLVDHEVEPGLLDLSYSVVKKYESEINAVCWEYSKLIPIQRRF
jgi:hypothetical protein